MLDKMKNNRGIALLIVLLVTALLIALIFEFAYATRISLNSAVNFRDSQRAYFLARSGIYAFVKYPKIQDVIPQGEWGIVPMISEGDTQVRIKWEDERGKINVNTVTNTDTSKNWLELLFNHFGISVEAVKVLRSSNTRNFFLISEVQAAISDEDYSKIAKYITTASDQKININTASEEVLSSAMQDNLSAVNTIINTRKDGIIQNLSDVGLSNANTVSFYKLDVGSTTYKVYSYATVGGYTKQIEAIIQRGSATPLYWRAL